MELPVHASPALAALNPASRAPPPPPGLLARAAHDLKAPLAAVLNLAELMATDTEVPLPARHRGHLQHLMCAGQHLVGLIEDVLDLSRLQAGQAGLRSDCVELGDLAVEAMACTAADAAARGLHTTLQHSNQPVRVLGDRLRCRQVLVNLLTNAVKYNRFGGQLTVRVGSDGSIGVADSGPGLTAQQIGQLFQPYQRLGPGGEDSPAGHGLGLALSRSWMQLMGGSLSLSSSPGLGTLATMQLPLAAAVVPATADTPEAQPLAAPAGHLLCIDDNPVNALLLQEFFQVRRGLPVRVAHTGAEGLALARAERPLAVLLDLHLPDFSGLEVLRRLRAAPETRHTPVAIVSGTVNDETLDRALALGAQVCWPKPLNLQRLPQLLAELLATPVR